MFDDNIGENLQGLDTGNLMAMIATYEWALRFGNTPHKKSSLIGALVDLGSEAEKLGDNLFRLRFAKSIARYFDCCILEQPYRSQQIVPTLEGYRRMRSWNGAVTPVSDLIHGALSQEEFSDSAFLVVARVV